MICFRDAIEADLPAIVALLAEDKLGRGREQPGLPLNRAYTDGFRAMCAQGGRIVLALDGMEIVGCLQLNILHGVSTLGQARAQVEGVRVAGSRRGQGVGAQLMHEAIRQAKEHGAGMMQLTTNQSRIDAQRFYLQLGFAASHIGMKLNLETAQ